MANQTFPHRQHALLSVIRPANGTSRRASSFRRAKLQQLAWPTYPQEFAGIRKPERVSIHARPEQLCGQRYPQSVFLRRNLVAPEVRMSKSDRWVLAAPLLRALGCLDVGRGSGRLRGICRSCLPDAAAYRRQVAFQRPQRDDVRASARRRAACCPRTAPGSRTGGNHPVGNEF